jgi:hypothetical protein
MSSKSSHNQPQWKPNNWKALGPAGREKVRENKKDLQLKAFNARRAARGLPPLDAKGEELTSTLPLNEKELEDIKTSIVPTGRIGTTPAT